MKHASRNINEHRLRYFYEVVSSGSIRGAAERLDVAASVVTRQIQQLERELGSKLLERRGRNVVPTDAAALVLDHCRERWASEEMLLARLDEMRGLQRGEIRVVAGEGFLEELSHTLSYDFCRRYPNINLTLEQVSSYEVVRMVLQDQAHVGIAYCAPESRAIRIIESRRLPVGLVACPDHPLIKGRSSILLKDVLPYPVALMQEQFGVRKLLMAAEYADKLEFSPAFTTNSLAALKTHVKARLGVTFMSRRGVQKEIEAGELATVRIENAVLESAEIQLIVRSGRVASAALLQVQKCLAGLPIFADDPAGAQARV